MGKFLNKTYLNTIDSIINKSVDRLEHSFYTFIDKPPTTVTYYNINTSNSTLDEGTGTSYSYTTKDSSLRFNKIANFILYGIEKIQTQLEAGDFGVEASDIEGEAVVIPGTIKPFPQDYFSINHLEHDILFKVTNVSQDTLPNGVNAYKINYRLSTADYEDSEIESLVVKRFTTITSNLGTNLAAVIEDNDYDYCKKLDDLSDSLRVIYRSLFYSDKTQTFIYTYDDKNFYDPYCIEFIIRNKLMQSGDLPYLHIDHQLYCGSLFPIEYTKTFFYGIEEKIHYDDLKNPHLEATLILDRTSLLSRFIEDYYVVHFHKFGAAFPVPSFDDDIIMRIKNKQFYPIDSPEYFKNILIMYFNNLPFDHLILDKYKDLDFYHIPAHELFYYIPVAIYIFERAITEKMKKLAD